MTKTFACKWRLNHGLWLMGAPWVILAAPMLPAQAPAEKSVTAPQGHDAATPVYDVASIRAFKPGASEMMVMTRTDPDGVTATHVTLQSLVCNAYGLSSFQVSGGPGWVYSDYYDLNAKMDESTMEMLNKLPPKQAWLTRRRMLQAVLAERFKLAVHTEAKQLPVYALVVAKNGPKLKKSTADAPSTDGIRGPGGQQSKGLMRMGFENGEMVVTAEKMSMDWMASQLGAQLRTKVENKTGLDGSYDFTFKYAPGDSLDTSASSSFGPDIFAAIQEQLGLKLESQKAPVETLVIDHVERPSEN